MVEAVDFIASEHQFVILEQIDAVLIDIDLQQGVVRMYGQFIVIRECYDVIFEFPVSFIGLCEPIFDSHSFRKPFTRVCVWKLALFQQNAESSPARL